MTRSSSVDTPEWEAGKALVAVDGLNYGPLSITHRLEFDDGEHFTITHLKSGLALHHLLPDRPLSTDELKPVVEQMVLNIPNLDRLCCALSSGEISGKRREELRQKVGLIIETHLGEPW